MERFLDTHLFECLFIQQILTEYILKLSCVICTEDIILRTKQVNIQAYTQTKQAYTLAALHFKREVWITNKNVSDIRTKSWKIRL